jgi:hypothetical protein
MDISKLVGLINKILVKGFGIEHVKKFEVSLGLFHSNGYIQNET